MTRQLDAGSLRRLRRRFDLIPDALKTEAKRVIDDAASTMIAEMKRATDDRSGALDASMKAQPVEVDHAVRVRVTVGGTQTQKKIRGGVKAQHAAKGQGLYDYARGVEYGTPHSPPEPFFRPSRDRTAKRLRFRLRAALKKTLAKMAAQNPG